MTERVAPAPFALSSDAPALAPLEGASVLVNVVVNLEHWSLDAPMPRAALPAPQGLTVVPDVANHSWVLYGLRAGLPRLAEALAPLGTKVSVAVNAEVVEHYESVAELVEALGWEVLAHGLRQRSAHTYDDEAAMVAETLRLLEARFGRPRGWLSPGMNQTDDSLRLLRAHGVGFTHDWMIDDRPTWLGTSAGPMVGLPYTLALNDVTTYVVEHQVDGSLADRTLRTLDVLRREATRGPVVMPIGLHPHVMGVAHRTGEVERIVAAITGTDGVRACRSSEIHDWFTGQVGPPC
ncbi:MAG: hypothetical protein M3Y51_08770 [Actinomycetota bacterium]|nr:hypothetical protein [Actinomycetota bacterium]